MEKEDQEKETGEKRKGGALIAEGAPFISRLFFLVFFLFPPVFSRSSFP